MRGLSLRHPGREASSPFWNLAPFVDFPGTHGSTEYRFEWERESRVPRRLFFSTDEVAFLFFPENLHSHARTFSCTAEEANIGPSYRCPILDPLWPNERIQEALANV